jgi:ABC-2 type transport system ATP-binding protein
VIIANGQVRAAGSRDELRRSRSRPHFELVVEPDAGWLLAQPGVNVLSIDGPRAVVEIADAGLDQWLLDTALAHGTVRAFAPVTPTLAEIFREVVEEEVADERQPVGR